MNSGIKGIDSNIMESANMTAARQYREKRQRHWDSVACKRDSWVSIGTYYHKRLSQVYNHLVSPGLRVLEIGCGTGDLLAQLKPSVGVGVDLSGEMIKRATIKYPYIKFIQADAHGVELDGIFDIIILSDLVNDLWDVQEVLNQLYRLSNSKTRIIMNMYSRLWEIPLLISKALGLSTPMLPQNWLTVEDIKNMINLAGFEVFRHWQEILWPFDTPVISSLCNKMAVKIWPFSYLALTNFLIARKRPTGMDNKTRLSVSVVIPARIEEGNIHEIFQRVPEIGSGTELIFVEGNSCDNTYRKIEETISAHPQKKCKLLRQTGKGKGDAVRLGFQNASGDILMILDADMTVPPEDLTRFYKAIVSGEGEFVNGVRLVYPMEKQAMRYLNLVGNKFFSLAFSWILGQTIKDTLCGTKVLSRQDYFKIAENREYFGNFDPFGDFDLLFGAAKQNMKIIEMPIRYAERKYGNTNIARWRHGWLLLRMTIYAMKKIKFI